MDAPDTGFRRFTTSTVAGSIANPDCRTNFLKIPTTSRAALAAEAEEWTCSELLPDCIPHLPRRLRMRTLPTLNQPFNGRRPARDGTQGGDARGFVS